MRWKRNPLRECRTRVGIHANVLPNASRSQGCFRHVAQKRNGRPRKIHCSAVVGSDDLDDTRFVQDGVARARSRGPEGKTTGGDLAHCSVHGVSRDERLVALNIHNGVECTELAQRGDFRDPIGARGVIGGREHDFSAMLAYGVGDLVTVGCDDAMGRDVERLDALPDADYQRQTGEEAKWFSGEAARTQPGWDHSERLHARRSAGQETQEAAPITDRNVFAAAGRRNLVWGPTHRSASHGQARADFPFPSCWIDGEIHTEETQSDS